MATEKCVGHRPHMHSYESLNTACGRRPRSPGTVKAEAYGKVRQFVDPVARGSRAEKPTLEEREHTLEAAT
jgi:hypothetical protein